MHINCALKCRIVNSEIPACQMIVNWKKPVDQFHYWIIKRKSFKKIMPIKYTGTNFPQFMSESGYLVICNIKHII